MHNLPTNNETNLIRDIFARTTQVNKQLQEGKDTKTTFDKTKEGMEKTVAPAVATGINKTAGKVAGVVTGVGRGVAQASKDMGITDAVGNAYDATADFAQSLVNAEMDWELDTAEKRDIEARQAAAVADPEFQKRRLLDPRNKPTPPMTEAVVLPPQAPNAGLRLGNTFQVPKLAVPQAQNMVNSTLYPRSPVPSPTTIPATRSAITPGSSKQIMNTITSSPTADVLKTIQGIVNTPSTVPEPVTDQAINQPIMPSVNPQSVGTPIQSVASAPSAREIEAQNQRAEIARGQGFGNNKTGTWDKGAFEQLQANLKAERDANQQRWENSPNNPKNKKPAEQTGPQSIPESYYYHRLANLFEETRDSLEDISAKRRERQVKVAGLEGQVNPHGFVDLVRGIRNVQAFSGMGGADMPKERVEKREKTVGKKTVGRADQRKALMTIMSASQNDPDFKDRFTKEDALNPDSPLHKALVSKNSNLRDESKVMAKYYTPS
jgi:hypothetical protein